MNSSETPLVWTHDGHHAWSRADGARIRRMWPLGRRKEAYFLCFRDQASCDAGDNFASHPNLRAAKAAF